MIYEQALSPKSAIPFAKPEVASVVNARMANSTRPAVRVTTAISTAVTKSKGKRALQDSTNADNGNTSSSTSAQQTKPAKKVKVSGSFKENTPATSSATATSANNSNKSRHLRSRNQMNTNGHNNDSAVEDKENVVETSIETSSKRAVITNTDTTAAVAQSGRSAKRRR
jgi:hypothetical protein